MAAAHKVVSRLSWGSLPEALRPRWRQLKCDSRDLHRRSPPTVARDAGGGGGGGGASECMAMQVTHKVRVGVSWGSLPLDLQKRWTRLSCDGHVN